MKKNVSGQHVGAQMVSSSDGSDFTGTVTVYITGDGGSQTIGSVGSGVCTHKGNGYHEYAPSQAETNFDHIAFTFVGSGAVSASPQVFTTFPQTGDAYARLGAPAGASVAADVAAVKAQTQAIDTVTARLGTMIEAAAGSPGEFKFTPDALRAIISVTPTAIENADALLTRDMSAVTEGGGRTPLQAFRILRNRWVITGATQSIKKEDDSTESWSQTLGTTPGADPVTSTDPA